MESSLLASLLFLGFVALAGAAKLPPSLQRCKQIDPDYRGCMKKALQAAVPHLKDGTSGLPIPPIEPLHFKQIKIVDTPDRPVTLSLEFNNVDIIGMGNGVVDSVEMKPGSYHMKANLHSDSLFILKGQYKADGKILVLPVKGDGNCSITSPRLDAELEMIGQSIERDGETYWDVTDFNVLLKNLTKLTMDFTGLLLFPEDTLKFLNENSVEIANELKPALEDALGIAFKGMARRVFEKIPYNSVFPPA